MLAAGPAFGAECILNDCRQLQSLLLLLINDFLEPYMQLWNRNNLFGLWRLSDLLHLLAHSLGQLLLHLLWLHFSLLTLEALLDEGPGLLLDLLVRLIIIVHALWESTLVERGTSIESIEQSWALWQLWRHHQGWQAVPIVCFYLQVAGLVVVARLWFLSGRRPFTEEVLWSFRFWCLLVKAPLLDGTNVEI